MFELRAVLVIFVSMWLAAIGPLATLFPLAIIFAGYLGLEYLTNLINQ